MSLSFIKRATLAAGSRTKVLDPKELFIIQPTVPKIFLLFSPSIIEFEYKAEVNLIGFGTVRFHLLVADFLGFNTFFTQNKVYL